MSNKTEMTFHGAWGAPPVPKKPFSLPQKDQPKLSVSRKPNLGQILQTFSENTTAHGIPNIARSKRGVVKVFWLAVFLAMLGIFCWQGTTVLIEYLDFPSTTKVELITNSDLNFPSVTICNMNRFRRSKLAGTRFDGLIHLDGGLNGDDGTVDYSWWFNWDSEWYANYMQIYGEGANSASGDGGLVSNWPNDATGTTDTFTQTAPNTLQVSSVDEETTSALAEMNSELSAFPSTTGATLSASTGLAQDDIAASVTEEDQIEISESEGEGTAAEIPPDQNTSSLTETLSGTTASTDGADIDSNTPTTLTTMTSAGDGNTTPGTPPAGTATLATANDGTPPVATDSSSSTAPETSSGEEGTTTIAVSATEITTVGSGQASSTATLTNSGSLRVSGTTHGSTEPSVINQTSEGSSETTAAEATETARRKKRSVRNIRDTVSGTSTNTNNEGSSAGEDIEDTVGEFGSWVRQEWDDGSEEDDETEFEFHYEEYFDWGNVTDPNDWESFYRLSTSPDYSDFLDIINPTRRELKEYGHQAEDLIVQCTFDKRSCSFRDFKEFQNKEYGNCFTFNHGSMSKGINTTKNSGAQYGLHLTLFLETPEYVGILSPEAGVRVSIHPHTTPPFPEDDGITVAPGMATNIGIRQVYIERLDEPYNKAGCKKFSSSTYSRKSCLKKCVQEHMYDRCHCVSDILLENKTKCSYISWKQQKCKQLIEYLGEEKRLECDCPIACNETTYTKAVSSSFWPSERYEEHLLSRLQHDPESAFAARIAQSEDSTSRNLVRLRVYFEELNYQSIKESPLYTFPNLLGNVGGLLGLYIGVSFLTLAEVASLIFDIFKYLTKKVFCRDQVTPSTVA